MSAVDDIAAGLLSVARMGRDAVRSAASAPPVVQEPSGGGRLRCLLCEATR